MMYLEFNNKKYEIVIERKNNKNTYIRVKDDLLIHVTTGKFTTKKSIEKLINSNYDSICDMIRKIENRKEEKLDIMILGKKVDIISLTTQKEPELYNNKFYIKDMNNYDKYIKEYAFNIFKERLDYTYKVFKENIPYPKLKIRSMTTRWGVCNKKDISVTLNLELIRRDIKYLDYVIVHELCHFVHFNHSSDFWNLVSKYCKDYKEIRNEMKKW